MNQATRTRRHLRKPKARRMLKILNLVFDAAGLAVFLWVAYTLVLMANEYLNGG
jgi:hypothetical protein